MSLVLDSSRCKSLVGLAPFVAFMLAQSMTVFPSAVSCAPILKVCAFESDKEHIKLTREHVTTIDSEIQTWLHQCMLQSAVMPL